jgi:hypothetical protein
MTLIYPSAVIGLIAVWPLLFVMLDVKSALEVKSVSIGWIVRAMLCRRNRLLRSDVVSGVHAYR